MEHTFIVLIELISWLITWSFWASCSSISGKISRVKSALVVLTKKVCTEPGHFVTFCSMSATGWSTISKSMSRALSELFWPLIPFIRRHMTIKAEKWWRPSILSVASIVTDDAEKQDFFFTDLCKYLYLDTRYVSRYKILYLVSRYFFRRVS